MIWAAVRLLQATNESAFLALAERWCTTLDRHFWDAPSGGYALTADDTPDVIVRVRGAHDDAVPNANAVMLTNLVTLFLITGNATYLKRAEAIPRAFAADLLGNAFGHCGLLASCCDLIAPQQVVVVKGAAVAADRLTPAMFRLSLPGAVQLALAANALPKDGPLADKRTPEGVTTAYACLGPQCAPPVTEPEALLQVLRAQRSAPPA
jgi:uncharacterized protein YyaL (SSP411 family)